MSGSMHLFKDGSERQYKGTPMGHFIRDLRESRNLSQERLAPLCGAEQGPISAIELGKTRPEKETLEKIFSALGFKYEEFVISDRRTCARCRVTKPIDAFRVHNSGNGRINKNRVRRMKCTDCINKYMRERHHRPEVKRIHNEKAKRKFIHRKYGITLEEFNDILLKQGGCKICGKLPDMFKKRFHVDHCHRTGRNRGILCQHCNAGIGYFGDSIRVMKNAIKYLKEHGSYGD